MILGGTWDPADVLVDWGNTSLRAYRRGHAGRIERRCLPEGGILSVHGAFEPVLREALRGWLAEGCTVWIGGMAASRNGWVEAPYAPVPVRAHELQALAVERTIQPGIRLRFLPGVSQVAPWPDVMRGEELQVFGCVGPRESALLVLPGTHSKWVRTQDGAIAGLRTYLTGELFALVCEHSSVGKVLPSPDAVAHADAFLRGVRSGLAVREGDVLHALFSVRSATLLGQIAPSDAREHLSGLLIGAELASGMHQFPGWRRATVVGAKDLALRYATALRAAGLEAELVDDGDVAASLLGAR